jgi:predicted site-specific integrase-resolvase
LEQNKNDIRNQVKSILHNHQVLTFEELTAKQDEAVRNLYALESSREQKKDIANRKRELEDTRDCVYESIMKYVQYFISAEELTESTMQKLQEVIRDQKQETIMNCYGGNY